MFFLLYICINKITVEIMFYLPIIEISYRENKIKELEDKIKDLCEDLTKDEDVAKKKAIMHLVSRYNEKIEYLKLMNNITLWKD